MKRPDRHIWEEDSTHRSVAGKEYDEVWDYAEWLEAEVERLRVLVKGALVVSSFKDVLNEQWIKEAEVALKVGESDAA